MSDNLRDIIEQELKNHMPQTTYGPYERIYCACSPGIKKSALYRDKFPHSKQWIEWTPAHAANMLMAALQTTPHCS